MTFKKALIILLLMFSILPTNKSLAQISNAGFVPGNIWYSTDPFEEGDKIKIYTVIFNSEVRELSGSVVFFDNSIFLGKKDFIAPAKGVKDVFMDWTATVGTHNIFGKIENAKFLVSPGKYEEVYLAENETSKSSRIVNKKITINPDVKSESRPESILESVGIKNIEKVIGENTPEFIARPIVLGASTIENFRQDIGIASKNKKEDIQSQIKILDNNAKITVGPKETEVSKFLKPFKYMELFFFSFLSLILNNKLIFYLSFVVIIFLILRYVWHLIF